MSFVCLILGLNKKNVCICVENWEMDIIQHRAISEACLKVCVYVAVDLLENGCIAGGANLNISCTEMNAWWINDSHLTRYCCFHCGSKIIVECHCSLFIN